MHGNALGAVEYRSIEYKVKNHETRLINVENFVEFWRVGIPK
jgi:hypothetical protein